MCLFSFCMCVQHSSTTHESAHKWPSDQLLITQMTYDSDCGALLERCDATSDERWTLDFFTFLSICPIKCALSEWYDCLTLNDKRRPTNSWHVVAKNCCPSDGFSILTGSATVCWHSGLKRTFRSPGRRKSRLCRDFRSVAHSNSPYHPRMVWRLRT